MYFVSGTNLGLGVMLCVQGHWMALANLAICAILILNARRTEKLDKSIFETQKRLNELTAERDACDKVASAYKE